MARMTAAEKDAALFDSLLDFVVRVDLYGGDRLRELLTDVIASNTEAREQALLIAALAYLHACRQEGEPL